jgi:hypothetical protein
MLPKNLKIKRHKINMLPTYLYPLYSSPHTFRGLKLRKRRWAAHFAHMGDRKNIHRIFVRKLEENTTW